MISLNGSLSHETTSSTVCDSDIGSMQCQLTTVTVPTATNDWVVKIDKQVEEDDAKSENELDIDPDSYLRLNVGGHHYRLRIVTILKFGHQSLLAVFARASHSARMAICDGWEGEKEEYYFERNGHYFEAIFDFCTTGSLHRPSDFCPQRFVDEVQFWRIDCNLISPCCARGLQHLLPTNPPKENDSKSDSKSRRNVDQLFVGQCCANARRTLWTLTENPQSSTAAKLFTAISIGSVLLSVSALILGSVPELQVYDDKFGEKRPHNALIYVEHCCILWFTLEYALRIFSSPSKCEFMQQSLNVIDLVAILPFYMDVMLDTMSLGAKEMQQLQMATMVMRLSRLVRVIRVFKLARYSRGLQSFGATMRSAIPEITMLLVFLATAIVFFSTSIYFLEKDEPGTQFYSIPAACWWSVVTMTTVGYGDMVPVTVGGKLLASLTSISGILVLAFPITMIVQKFNIAYAAARHAEERNGHS